MQQLLMRRSLSILPDFEGPIDNIDVLRSTEIITDFYNDPQLVTGSVMRRYLYG